MTNEEHLGAQVIERDGSCEGGAKRAVAAFLRDGIKECAIAVTDARVVGNEVACWCRCCGGDVYVFFGRILERWWRLMFLQIEHRP